jgi:hypothetical protein
LLRPTLARLPVERAIDRASSFQLTRSARLILALHTLSFMYAPHEHAQHRCQRVLSVACPGFLRGADIKGDVGATREVNLQRGLVEPHPSRAGFATTTV